LHSANIVRGVPIEKSAAGNLEYVGGFFNLLNPYALLGGVVTLTVFLTHGAISYLSKRSAELVNRLVHSQSRLDSIAAVAAVSFLVWTNLMLPELNTTVLARSTVVALAWVAGLFATLKVREGWAFIFSAVAIAIRN
jgi:cytochrome d ubiquinol oxidase subunit II